MAKKHTYIETDVINVHTAVFKEATEGVTEANTVRTKTHAIIAACVIVGISTCARLGTDIEEVRTAVTKLQARDVAEAVAIGRLSNTHSIVTTVSVVGRYTGACE